MDTKTYHKTFEVRYCEINKNRQATPVAILNYLGEASVSHSSSVGFGVDKLISQGVCWVLSNWSLNMYRYPTLNENIVIETWPSSFQRFFSTREFIIKDADNKIIGKASSLWVFFSIEKRKPLRIPEEFGDAYGINPLRAIDTSFELNTEFNNQYIAEFPVRRIDIDANHHVNNVKYAEWILETIPEDIYNSCMLSSLEILYKKEVGYGEIVCCGCENTAVKEDESEFSHSILNKGTGMEIASAKSIWKKII